MADRLLWIPEELRAEHRWVTWAYERRGRQVTKRPYQKINDMSAWLTFQEATKRWADDEHISGVGFVLGDGIVGADLDGCIDADGTLHEIARDAIALGSYVERSPSGRGLHLLIRAAILRPRKIGAIGDDPGRELYDGREDSARYFSVTGDRLGDVSEIRAGPKAQAALDAFVAKWFPEEPQRDGTSIEPDGRPDALDDDRLLLIMFSAKDGAKWRQLYGGDWSAFPSQSEADFALCRKLRFYTRAFVPQMDRLFRHSGLMRRKWDERRGEQTYGERTIEAALTKGGRLYGGRPVQYVAGASEGQRGKVHKSVLPVLARLTRTDILTYLAVALHADEAGECYPSAARVASLFGTTREHVQASIGNLGRSGLLKATKRLGRSSRFQLPAYMGVSKFDTGSGQATRRSNAPKATHVGDRQKRGRPARPVSDLDTPPVSKLDTQTDKEQSIDTGERGPGVSEDDEPKLAAKVILFPEPHVPLSPDARRLRDEMLQGPVGRFFFKRESVAE